MHPYRGGLTGNKAWNKVFKPDRLNDSRIVVVDVRVKMREYPWQLGLLHLHKGGWTGKEGWNKTFMDVRFGTVTIGHLSSLQDGRRGMPKRSGSMQHIWPNCKGGSSNKERGNGRLIWLNYSRDRRIKGGWNSRLNWMDCNGGRSKSGWKRNSTRPIWPKRNNSRSIRGG
jgi:hypothetical protein